MNKKRKVFFVGLVTSFTCLSGFATSCNSRNEITTTIKDHYVYSAFRDVGPNISVDEFNKVFSVGDIIDVKIDANNGKTYSLILPYVNNYSEAGDYAPCLCADTDQITSEPAIDLSLNMWPYGHDVRTRDFFNCPVKFTMNKKGGYNKILNFVKCSEKLTIDQLSGDDKAYANFRGIIETGDISKFIKTSHVYRSSTPLISGYDLGNRYNYVDALMENNNIEEVLCLSHDKAGYKRRIDELKSREENYYIRSLFGDGETNCHCHCIDLGNDYFSLDVVDEKGRVIEQGGASKVREVLKIIGECCKDNKRLLIHCDEGKDRTGFICMLLEAFATPMAEVGGLVYISTQDIVSDFMTSYRNYYNITSTDNVERYQTFLDMTIYRHLYAICCDNPAKELGQANWYDTSFDVRDAFRKKIQRKNLWYFAKKYIKDVVALNDSDILNLSRLYTNEIPEFFVGEQ